MSAICYSCSTPLTGSWNMTTCGGFEKTGRYLGITDGYFLYGVSPHWVYCYCYNCWKAQILALPFVQSLSSQVNQLNADLSLKNDELNLKTQKLNKLKIELEEKTIDADTKSQEIKRLCDQLGSKDETARNETNQLSLQVVELTKKLEMLMQDLSSAQHKILHLKEQLATNQELLKEKDQEMSIIAVKFPQSFGFIDSLRDALSELEMEQSSKLQARKLDLESIKSTAEKEIDTLLVSRFQEKFKLLSELCTESIKEYDNKLKQFEETEKQLIQSMRGQTGLFTEDISGSLKPIQKKKEMQELLRKKWIKLKISLDTFGAKNLLVK